MKKTAFWALLLGILAVIGLLYTGWGSRQDWNQRVTLVIETPDGVVERSTVLAYQTAYFPKRINAPWSRRLGLFGEAPFIEIEPGRHLFALSLYAPYEMLRVYADYYQIKATDIEALKEKILANRDIVVVPKFKTPQFFTFTDPNDPSTLKEVNIDRLNREFGEGYKFRKIKLQVTDEPKTRGVMQTILPWVDSHRGVLNPVKQFKSWHKTWHKADFTTLNRSILTRHYDCAIDGVTMNNLTYGFWRTGIGCSY